MGDPDYLESPLVTEVQLRATGMAVAKPDLLENTANQEGKENYAPVNSFLHYCKCPT
jgi:hypothetical protein